MSFFESKYQLKTSYFSEIFSVEASTANFSSKISKRRIKISKTRFYFEALDLTLESASKKRYIAKREINKSPQHISRIN